MPEFRMKRRVTAHADVVWKVISDVGGLAEVAPHISRVEIVSGEKLGLRRRLYDHKGHSWEEEVVAWEDEKSYTIEVDTTDYPFAFKRMRVTASMERGERMITIRLRINYAPKYGYIGQLLDRYRFVPRAKLLCNTLLDNWVRQIYAREWAYRVTVRTILKEKGGDIITVTPEDTVIDTVRLLCEKKIGSVLALKADGSIAGVFSERDVVRGLAEVGPDVLNQKVGSIMTTKVVVCEPDDNMMLVMACMTDRRVRHLPVMDGDKLLGIISIGDVVKTRIAELETESATLRDYIAGRRWRDAVVTMGPGAYEHPVLVPENPPPPQ